MTLSMSFNNIHDIIKRNIPLIPSTLLVNILAITCLSNRIFLYFCIKTFFQIRPVYIQLIILFPFGPYGGCAQYLVSVFVLHHSDRILFYFL